MHTYTPYLLAANQRNPGIINLPKIVYSNCPLLFKEGIKGEVKNGISIKLKS